MIYGITMISLIFFSIRSLYTLFDSLLIFNVNICVNIIKSIAFRNSLSCFILVYTYFNLHMINIEVFLKNESLIPAKMLKFFVVLLFLIV